MANRLGSETSPYLLQHKHNPVDWYPWGEEALTRAREEDRPILLSVGYSACHWCHVMEHESFADPDTAALMNERFINIKVDREERPDIDSLYMQAVQQMTGRGGWPMTVFLRPDGAVFYGGTYFPPEPRHGMPSFRQVLMAVSEAYRTRRAQVDRSADQLRSAVREGMAINPERREVDESTLQRAFQALAARYDDRHGGFGGAPKFPQPMIVEFLLCYWARTGHQEALRMVEHTLDHMANGGIHDQIGGGFHRYSVDTRWLVPHFEKMLYDNALLSRTYVLAYQATGRPRFRAVAESTFAYIEREMLSEDGAFYSSQDADSEGEEGKFYVWSASEIDEVLPPEDARIFKRYYDISRTGNWEGKNIPNVPRGIGEAAEELAIEPPELARSLERSRSTLYSHRAKRVWPGRDDKVVTAWNAMMLRAYAEGAWVFGSDHYRRIAAANADFLLGRLRRGDRVLRSWRAGEARIDGFLEDYALLTLGLISLYRTTFERRWLEEARSIAECMIDRFWSREEGIFYDAPEDGEQLIVRPRDIYDNATPSGTSAAVDALRTLAHFTGGAMYQEIASRVLQSMAETASQVPQAFGNLLGAVDGYIRSPVEVAIVGRPDASDTNELLAVLRTRFLPHAAIALRSPSDGEEVGEAIPVLAGRTARNGGAAAYVCQNFACRQPVTTPAELAREVDSLGML